MTFCMPQSALHNLSDFLHLCVGVESVSKIVSKLCNMDEVSVQNEAYDQSDKAWQHK